MKRILIMTMLTMMLFSFSPIAFGETAQSAGGDKAESQAAAGELSASAVDFVLRDGYAEMNAADGTKVIVFGSDEASFQVTSTLIVRNRNALLIDTKFARSDAEKIVAYLRSSGARLTQIYISHGDPDYYFGLEEIKAVYPDVVAQATRRTTRHITRTVLSKLEVWAPVLGDQIPKNVVFPKPMDETRFQFEGLDIQIFGSDRARTTLYIPALKMLVGGANITSGNHLFLADMSRDEDREGWLASLTDLKALNAEIVIPGHSDLPNERFDNRAIDFSIEYLRAAAEVLETAGNSGEFIAAMEERYPNLRSRDVLVLSGMVLMGEMEWRRYVED